MAVAAGPMALRGIGQAAELPQVQPGTNTSFRALKQIDAGVLNIGYAEDGAAGGADHPAAWMALWHLCLCRCRAAAASAGYRVIVPYLRGYGSTRFLSLKTKRNGQQAVVAVDVLALMDALHIERAVVGGFDWGARTANIIAALWPARCKAMVSVSGYLIGSQQANSTPRTADDDCGDEPADDDAQLPGAMGGCRRLPPRSP